MQTLSRDLVPAKTNQKGVGIVDRFAPKNRAIHPTDSGGICRNSGKCQRVILARLSPNSRFGAFVLRRTPHPQWLGWGRMKAASLVDRVLR
jgi:hypothetical protein